MLPQRLNVGIKIDIQLKIIYDKFQCFQYDSFNLIGEQMKSEILLKKIQFEILEIAPLNFSYI